MLRLKLFLIILANWLLWCLIASSEEHELSPTPTMRNCGVYHSKSQLAGEKSSLKGGLGRGYVTFQNLPPPKKKIFLEWLQLGFNFCTRVDHVRHCISLVMFLSALVSNVVTGVVPLKSSSVTATKLHSPQQELSKKLCYRKRTARRDVSVKILPTAA